VSTAVLDRLPTLTAVRAEQARRSLRVFVREAWRLVEPDTPFVPNWHLDAICDHLEAVTKGDIPKLLINIPPGCAKSLLVAFWAAWEWATTPSLRHFTASYSDSLTIRDLLRVRDIVTSPWYQAHFRGVQLRSDQNQKTRMDTTAGGWRIATSVGGRGTGEHPDRIVIDDPHSAAAAESTAARTEALHWFDRTVSTRGVTRGARMVVIMQRLHQEDLSGHLLKRDGWTHLCLPMRFEPERRTYNVILPAEMDDEGKEIPAYVWTDPREEPGELLWQDRMGEREVEILEKQLGPWSAAGQLQQRPEPKGGGVIKREWWQLWDQDAFPGCDYIIASLDTAYTTKTENDLSALTIWGIFSGGDQKAQAVATRIMAADGEMLANVTRSYSEEHPRVMLMYAWQERLELHELVVKVQETMRRFKVDKLLIENKAAGHSVAQEIRRLYGHENFAVQLVDPKGQDKLARLYSVQHLFAEGMIYAPDRAWADMVITQCGTFPKGKHDDLVDTVSMGLRYLRETGLIIRNDEWTSDIEDKMMFSGSAPPPLYTV